MYQQPEGDFETEIFRSTFMPEFISLISGFWHKEKKMETPMDFLLKMFIWDEKHVSKTMLFFFLIKAEILLQFQK